MAQKLKVALIVDSPNVTNYVYDIAEWAGTQDHIEITHLIVQQPPITPQSTSRFTRAKKLLHDKGLEPFLSQILWSLMARLEQHRLQRGKYANHLSKKPMGTLVPNAILVVPEISKSGFVYRYRAEDIAKIKAEQFDVLLRCGSGILRGEILTASRFGILSFHHADNRVNRGGPPAFWEVYHREPKTGFVIQQLTEELDGGNVLFRGAFPTQRYFMQNQAELYVRSNHYLKLLLAKIADTQTLPSFEESKPYTYPLYKQPRLKDQLLYLFDLLIDKLQREWRNRALKQQQRWGVAYAKGHWKNLAMWKAHRIKNPTGRFLADPFVITREGRDYCFVEDYDYATHRGAISVYDISGPEAQYMGEALREPFHLSFPYLFEHEGALYMVPESAKNKDIRLYECISFPLQWKLKKVIKSNLSAADTMIFQHAGRWWLFTNMNPVDTGDHCSELYAFYSDDPVNGEWQPHAQNPLILDPTLARNGGLLRDDDAIYRVSQKYGFVQYGTGALIHRIEHLDPQQYRESLFCDIQPRFFDKLLGSHHMHSNGQVCAFDFVEYDTIS